MTHYCSLGNQPRMELMNPGENNMLFVLSEKNPNLRKLICTRSTFLLTTRTISLTPGLFMKRERKN